MAQTHPLTESVVSLNANPVPFAFKDHPIRTVVNGAGSPWFVAKDVCVALAIDWSGKTLAAIPADWVSMGKVPTRRRGLQDMKIISEPAVYKLAFRSNKPEADEFTSWVASEVLPAIRKTGKFEASVVNPTTEHSALPRLTTAKERNQLVVLVNRYIGAQSTDPSKEAYKQAWRKVHDVMGIKAIEELTVEQLPRAVTFMQALVEALPAGEPQKSLPPARAKFGSMDMLVVSEDVATFSRKKDEFSKELYSAVVAAKSAMRTATRSGGNPRTAAEMLLSEIRALEAQFDATCSAVHMFELALFRVDRIVKIAEAM